MNLMGMFREAFFSSSKDRRRSSVKYLLAAIALLAPLIGSAQSVEDEFAAVAASYSLVPNITYFQAGGVDLKLDVYQPRNVTDANPTLIYFHGGGWTTGTKESSSVGLIPYLQMGFTVVNVEYRLSRVAHAPAAVEDTRCALRWVYRNAEEYGFDTNRIVLSGGSAGGHLALITGMLPESAGMERACPGNRSRVWSAGSNNDEEMRVAAIVNWYGITDVEGMIGFQSGPSGPFTDAWLGNNPNRREVARSVSPLTYVTSDLPPILTIHGDSDPVVPYEQNAVQLKQALDEAGVTNRLVTVQGAGHGSFSVDQMVNNYRIIREFLAQQGVMPE